MTTEAHIIIAFLYKRSGKPIQTESDLYLSLSMDLGWMTTTDAKTFIHQAADNGLLTPKDQGFAPTFDITTIQIPHGFIPKPISTLKETKPHPLQPSLLNHIIDKISNHTKQTPTVIMNEVTSLAEEKKVIPEVAALWIARRQEVDVSEFYDPTQEKIAG